VLVGSVQPDGRGRALVGLGNNAQDPGRLIAFLDWLATPDVFQDIHAGPRGLTWDMVGGQPVLTPFGFEAGQHNQAPSDVAVPAAWGGGEFELGGWRSVNMILRHRGWEMNPNTGFTYDPRHWPSVASANASRLELNWQAHFNSPSQIQYMRDHNILVTAPQHGVDWVHPVMDSDTELMFTTIRAAIRPNNWRMIFAANEAEFNQIWEETKATANGLGWAQLEARERALAAEFFALVNEYIRNTQ
jgi:hypothetical protein